MNIALTGMMGSGKTTIGELLCSELNNFKYIDTDKTIVEKENRSINKIFEEDGEEYFRDIESSVLKEILKSENQIISTGGGIVKRETNIKDLKKRAIVIYLKAAPETIYERIKNNKERPLLSGNDMFNKIQKILKEREDKYINAHFTIDTNNKNPDIIVREIMEKIKQYG